MLRKVPGPDRLGREAMCYADRQELAYRHGAYAYLASIAMLPRLAVVAAYLRAYAVGHVLDVGCGTAELLEHLPPAIAYTGIDIAPSAIERARERHGDRPATHFHVADFRHFAPAPGGIDAVLWAGIGVTWTRKGKGGDVRDWREILALAERPLAQGGLVVLELVSGHWPSLRPLVEDRYVYETGCDLDCFQSIESPKRSIRVFHKR